MCGVCGVRYVCRVVYVKELVDCDVGGVCRGLCVRVCACVRVRPVGFSIADTVKVAGILRYNGGEDELVEGLMALS